MAQIEIIVLDENEHPVELAEIKYEQGDDTGFILTNTDGFAHIDNAIPSIQNPFYVFIRHIGYYSIGDSLTVNPERIFVLTKKNFELDEIVITGQYNSGIARNALRKVRTITSTEIEQLGANSLSDALRQELNISVSSDNILGNALNLQGFSGEQVKVLIDGVPLIGRLNGSIDLNQIPLQSIERIEIVEGPLAVLYGTDAIGGTINLITKSSEKSDMSFNSFIESVGHYNAHASINYRESNHTIGAELGRNFFDGWSPGDRFIELPKSKPADSNRVQFFKPKLQYFTQVKYSYEKPGFNIKPYVRYFNEELTNRGYPRQPYLESAFDDVYKTHRLIAGVNSSLSIQNSKKLSLMASYSFYERHKNTYIKDLTNLGEELSGSQLAHDTTSIGLLNMRIIYNSASSDNLEYELGTEINSESIQGERIAGMSEDILDLAFFGTAEWKLSEQTVFRPGVRLFYNNKFGSKPIPSLAFKTGLNSFVFRASIAKAFRAPSLKELHLDFIDINHNIQGNSNLVAESGNHISGGIQFSHDEEKLSSLFELNGFYNRVINRIQLVALQNAGSFTYRNIGEFFSHGLNFEANFVLETIQAKLGAGVVSTKDDISQQAGIDGYNNLPQLTSTVSYSPLNSQGTFTLFYKYIGNSETLQLTEENQFILYSIESFHQLDASYNCRFLKDRLSFTIGLKNILDRNNISSINSGIGPHSQNNMGVNQQIGLSLFSSLNYSLQW